jgi:hypothetical protein
MSRIEGISSFSTTLRTSTKDLLDRFCKKRGLRMNYIVETAILEFLEDEMDKEIIEKRELEETIVWKQHG